MDTFQITSIILLSLIVVALGIGLVIGYKSIVRRDATAKSLQDAVDRLTPRLMEIEAAMKGHLPALERSTGETAKQLVEVAGLLRGLDHSHSKLLSHSETLPDLVRESKASIFEEMSTMTERIASATRTVGESTNEKIGALAGELKEMNTMTGRIASAARTAGESTNEKLSALVEELKELRKQLDEVTRF